MPSNSKFQKTIRELRGGSAALALAKKSVVEEEEKNGLVQLLNSWKLLE
jgi:hypothetical protein